MPCPIRTLPVLAALAAGLLTLGCETATEVDVLSPKTGRIVESFTEPAKTRLEKTWRITMPVAGRIGRIDLEPGDPVKQGDELVPFETLPLKKILEEARAAVAELEAELDVKDNNELENLAARETRATVQASEEALNASDAQVEAQQARAERAKTELKRNKTLHEKGTLSQSELDDTQLEADTAIIELRRQQFYRAALKALITAVRLGPRYVEEYLGRKSLERGVIVQKLLQAKARAAKAEHDLGLAQIVSPINGVVLERYEQGDGPLAEGTPLLLLGDLEKLEVEADVLTQDALRLGAESVVRMEATTGREELTGKVKRIEPQGFTKLSSLGVEQQRVNVMVSLDARPPDLKVGYRVQARFVTGSKDDAVVVPRFSVLQAADRSFYVYKVVDHRLEKQPVTLGLRSDLKLEIAKGVTTEDTIVARPDTTLKVGQRVKPVRTEEE